jgi:hypothetical protein
MFANAIHLHPVLIFAGKAAAYQSGALMEIHSNGRLLPLPKSIRLEWKQMLVANILPYYDTATIMTVKSSMLQLPVAVFTTLRFLFNLRMCSTRALPA